MSINHGIKSLNGISQGTNITQRFPSAWSQTLQRLSSLCCSFRNTCTQTKCSSKDRSSRSHSSHQTHQPQYFPSCYTQQKGDRGPDQENSFLSQSDLREEKPCFQPARGRHLDFRLPHWKETQKQQQNIRKKQVPNLVIYNDVMHKMQLGVALTIKLQHFLQKKRKCDNTQYAAQECSFQGLLRSLLFCLNWNADISLPPFFFFLTALLFSNWSFNPTTT